MSFLGHIIDAHDLKADPEKVKAVQECERPNIVKEIRSFLGLAGYYNRFISRFSMIALAVTHLTKKGQRFLSELRNVKRVSRSSRKG